MGIRGPRRLPKNKAEFDRWARDTPVSPDDGSVTLAKMALAGADGQLLIRRAGAMAYDTLGLSDMPAGAATDAEVASAVATATGAITAAYTAADAVVAGNAAAALAALTTTAVPEGSNLYYTIARAQAAARILIVRSITTTDTVGATDDVILADATGGAITVNLPAVASNVGKRVTVKKIDASANAVTLDANASETIDGATTLATTTQYVAFRLVATAAGWWVI